MSCPDQCIATQSTDWEFREGRRPEHQGCEGMYARREKRSVLICPTFQDVNSVSESDARDIIGEVNNFVPNILDVLRKIEAKKDILLSLPIPGINGIILSSLQDLHQRSTALSDALINAAPVSNSFTHLERFSLIMVSYLGRSQESGRATEE
jgi:hypothetical protein